jgi:hypothetical protein
MEENATVKMIVGDLDLRFAQTCELAPEPVDMIAMLKVAAPEFYWFVVSSHQDVVSIMSEYGSKEYQEELEKIIDAFNFFLQGVWSANEGRLPRMDYADYKLRLSKMGQAEYLFNHFRMLFSEIESFHFLDEVYWKVKEISGKYAQCRVMLNMCIVMEAWGAQATN